MSLQLRRITQDQVNNAKSRAGQSDGSSGFLIESLRPVEVRRRTIRERDRLERVQIDTIRRHENDSFDFLGSQRPTAGGRVCAGQRTELVAGVHRTSGGHISGVGGQRFGDDVGADST